MKKGNPIALLPIVVFLVLFVGMGLVLGDFYVMPAIVGFIIALAVAFAMNPKLDFNQKLSIAAKGSGEENVITMCFIFLLAGAFAGAVQAAGGMDSTVNLGLSILPPKIAIIGVFVIACFISISMGTSVGTITFLTPIAIGIAEKTGFPMALCVGAVVCGAMFGDNLSMISDTTIAAVRTQGCEMKDKFRQNFFIVLPAAIVTILILYFTTHNSVYQLEEALPYDIWQVMPYLFVLVTALLGLNVFLVLMSGTVFALIVGVAQGTIPWTEMFQVVGSGVSSMFEITCISLLVAAIIALVKENGGIDFVLYLIRRNVKSKRGAELGIAVLASLMDICTANNTVAIVMAGPIAKDISEEFQVEPKSSASILDIFTSVWQGIIPYGAQLLTAATLVQTHLSKTGSDLTFTSFDIIPYLYYPALMGLCALVYFLFLKKEKTTA
ncbi:MAG: Na+/H+ antiporter NhaC family protein [Eubacteriales bacterium]